MNGERPEPREPRRPLHVALIMDGNGRWAQARGLPRTAGHRSGADAVRKVVEAAPGLGVGTLTLYAFSSDNWKRPDDEVSALMRLFRVYLRAERARLVTNGVRLQVIGRRDRLSATLCEAIRGVEEATSRGRRLTLRLAVDYSARDSILRAAERARGAELTRGAFASLIGEATHGGEPAPDVDLLVRTGGELRLSDFLLWECAYAELVFSPVLWPDFGPDALEAAIEEYHSRDRRFGRVTPSSVATA